MNKKIQIYCDGSCKGNGKKKNIGGWAYYLLTIGDNNKILSVASNNKRVENTTNNQMELIAAINGCIHSLKYMNNFSEEDWICEVYTDSAYIHRCKEEHWYKKWERNGWINSEKEPVKNKDLWKQLIPFFENKHFRFYKVKGHSSKEDKNSYWNNKADKLARGLEEN